MAPRPGYNLALSGVRGSDTQLRQYAVDDARLSIGPGAERGSLIGLLVLGDRALPSTSQARLLRDSVVAYDTEIDDLGNFEFEDLAAGRYVLELQLPDEIIVVEDLTID